MVRPNQLLPAVLIFAGILIAAGCGSGNSPRQLQSISLSPTSADAQNFPNGQVQFTATGTFTQPPSPAPTTPLSWNLSDATLATVSQNGVAQCKSGAVGATKVLALGGTAPCVGTGCAAALIVGSAQLTCP